MDLATALLKLPEQPRAQQKPPAEAPESRRSGTSFAEVANADRPGDAPEKPDFGYGSEDHGDAPRRRRRLDDLPLDKAFIEAIRKVIGEALQQASGKSALFGDGSGSGELFSEVTDLGKIGTEALMLMLAQAGGAAEGEGEAETTAGTDPDADLLAGGEALLANADIPPQIAGVAQTALAPGDGETAETAKAPKPGNAAHAVALPDAGDSMQTTVGDGTDAARTDSQATAQVTAATAQQADDLRQPAQMAAPAAEAAQADTPREARDGDRLQTAGPRGEVTTSDLSRMQRVTGPASLSQHHNGILVADTGHRHYEIRFQSADLGQIRVELQMDGQKPEASILYNNADAEKPLRDQFATLQTRLAGLGIENLVLRQDTRDGWAGNGNGAGAFGGDRAAPGEAPLPAAETEYYLMVPELTADGRLDIRF